MDHCSTVGVEPNERNVSRTFVSMQLRADASPTYSAYLTPAAREGQDPSSS